MAARAEGKAGCAERRVNAVAQGRVGLDVDVDAGVGGFDEAGMGGLESGGRAAAMDWQKSLLVEFVRHWVHVPGPLAHGSESVEAAFEDGTWAVGGGSGADGGGGLES